MKTLTLILMMVLCGCGPVVGEEADSPYPVTDVEDGWYGTRIYTVEHDGHKYVLARCTRGVAICPVPEE